MKSNMRYEPGSVNAVEDWRDVKIEGIPSFLTQLSNFGALCFPGRFRIEREAAYDVVELNYFCGTFSREFKKYRIVFENFVAHFYELLENTKQKNDAEKG